jgi:DNA/RNA-binding domain of Phe-tRNA-synthetase-like protein
MGHENHPLPIRVSRVIQERFPGYRAWCVMVRGIRNGPSDERGEAWLRAAERGSREAFSAKAPADHPHLAAWREAYRALGWKPSRFRCSAESLIRRALRSDGLPRIDRWVDLYNAVSVAHVLPVGGEDADRLCGPLELRLATGQEEFVSREAGREARSHPDPGEPIWLDDAGVTCRGWNWRQGVRTALGNETKNAFFVLDALPPFGEAELEQAAAALRDGALALEPACELSLHVLAGPRPSAGGAAAAQRDLRGAADS